MPVTAHNASLTIGLNSASTPIVLDFPEESSRAFGMTEGDAAKVRRASEEISEYLCRTAPRSRAGRLME